jgi:hypothetical protein
LKARKKHILFLITKLSFSESPEFRPFFRYTGAGVGAMRKGRRQEQAGGVWGTGTAVNDGAPWVLGHAQKD